MDYHSMKSLDLIKRKTSDLPALARREIGPIIAILALAVLVLAFRSIADEVGEGDTHAFDAAILYALRVPGQPGVPIGPWWLTTAATDVTSLGSITVLTIIVLLVFGLIASLRRPREAIVLLVASVGGIVEGRLSARQAAAGVAPRARH
jgi:undecaprenyl-diphosphatase